MYNMQMTGDWNRAGIYLKNLKVKLQPAFEAKLFENGEMVLDKIKGHIESQDLMWTPLSDKTIQLKGGDTTIYIDKGELYDGLVCRRIKSSVKGSTVYVGASPWKRHSGGMRMSDLMIWLEYGTDKIPPRPLIRPTLEEVKDIIQKSWVELLKDLVQED